jgi:hypothetical protein
MIDLAGAITNVDPHIQQENILRFYKKADELRRLGHKVYNPCEKEPPNRSHAYYLAIDLKWIHENRPKQFYFMKGWEQSSGAQEEHETALLLGADIIYET